MEDGTVPKKDYWHDPSLPHGLLFDYLDQYTTETGTAGFKEFIKEIATNPLLTIETALPAFRRILKVDSHIHVPFLEVLLARTQFLIDAQRNLAGEGKLLLVVLFLYYLKCPRPNDRALFTDETVGLTETPANYVSWFFEQGVHCVQSMPNPPAGFDETKLKFFTLILVPILSFFLEPLLAHSFSRRRS
jgi:hypothetical protein